MDATVLLRRARHGAGLSLRELAERAGTSHATLCDYEHGRRVPRVDTLARILRAAGFEGEVKLARRADDLAHRGAKGRELLDVLELAAQFPIRRGRSIEAPAFPRAPR